MNLTVDANIVAKWFLTEPQSGEARQLLAPRLRLHAPDVLPVEYANTIWKKVHRREIADTRPYLDGLTGLPEAVTLHDSRDLLNHALRIAVQMDHPVYDCLYLACAHATTSVLVTADQRRRWQTDGQSGPSLVGRYRPLPGFSGLQAPRQLGERPRRRGARRPACDRMARSRAFRG